MADADEVRKRRQKMADAYVHLKNTQTMLPNGEFIAWHGAYWRGKRSAVDGFWLGKVGDQ